jgi:hypothetical protein
MTDKRIKSIKIRVTEPEFLELNDLKVGGELATWMREVCLNKKSKRRNPPIDVDPKLLRHLSALGNNINQIARQCNRTVKPSDALSILVRLDAIQSELEKLRHNYVSENS